MMLVIQTQVAAGYQIHYSALYCQATVGHAGHAQLGPGMAAECKPAVMTGS